MKRLTAFTLLLLAAALPPGLRASAIGDLLDAAGGAEPAAARVEVPAVAAPVSAEGAEARQWLPENNDNPGFDWPLDAKREGEFVTIGRSSTFLKTSASDSSGLADGSGKCALPAFATFTLAARPGFSGQHMTVRLAQPLPNCSVTQGFIYLPHVSASSAGGFSELPREVKAFLDTLAFAEGTREHYNFIFTFVTFESFADHPRRRICSGGLCSTAAGRYQFLSRTWDGLAAELGLRDFTPPNQEKATLELIRRAGAYNNVARSSDYNNFTSALSKLNRIWASLPGSPYGQPTHPTSELWRYYKGRLALY